MVVVEENKIIRRDSMKTINEDEGMEKNLCTSGSHMKDSLN